MKMLQQATLFWTMGGIANIINSAKKKYFFVFEGDSIGAELARMIRCAIRVASGTEGADDGPEYPASGARSSSGVQAIAQLPAGGEFAARVEEAYVSDFNRHRAEKGGFRMQKRVGASDLHPLTKTLCPSKHGAMRRWIRGKVVIPSLRAVAVPAETGSPGRVLLPSAALARMGISIDPAAESKTLAVINRPPSISLSSVQSVEVGEWDSHCVGIDPRAMATVQGDYDGDELQVWLLSQASAAEIARLVEPVFGTLPEVDQLEAQGAAFPCIVDGLGSAALARGSAPSSGSPQLPEVPTAMEALVCLGPKVSSLTKSLLAGPAVRAATAGQLQALCEQLPAGMATGAGDPLVARAGLAEQRRVQARVGADTRLMRLALSPLASDGRGNVMWAGKVIGTIDPSPLRGLPGLRLAVSVGSAYQQGHLDAHKMIAARLSPCRLAESLVSPRQSVMASRPFVPESNVLLMGWVSERSVLEAMPTAKLRQAQLSIGQRTQASGIFAGDAIEADISRTVNFSEKTISSENIH